MAVPSICWKSSTKRVPETLGFPLLIRFPGFASHRVEAINRAFQSAISEFRLSKSLSRCFSIKVNQLREVVEEIAMQANDFILDLEQAAARVVAALGDGRKARDLDHLQWLQSPAFIRIAFSVAN